MDKEDYFKQKFKDYINKGWFYGIKPTRLSSWVGNFKDHEEYAYILLDSIILYTDPQIEAIILELQNRLQSQLYLKLQSTSDRRLDDSELFEHWNKYIKETCIVSAAKISDASGSGNQALRMWKQNSDITCISVSDLVSKLKLGIKNIIFVDDLIGTGSRIYEFLNDCYLENDSQKISIKKLMDEFNETQFSIMTFAAHKNGIARIRKAHPNLSILVADVYDDKYDLLSKNCIFYVNNDNKMDIIKYISDKKSELNVENPYSLNLPLAFHYGFPNNALELFWTNDIGGWEYLKKRKSTPI